MGGRRTGRDSRPEIAVVIIIIATITFIIITGGWGFFGGGWFLRKWLQIGVGGCDLTRLLQFARHGRATGMRSARILGRVHIRQVRIIQGLDKEKNIDDNKLAFKKSNQCLGCLLDLTWM